MASSTYTPMDRTAFNQAIAEVHAEHATLRALAKAASRAGSHRADDTLSLADAMMAHERAEARLMALPYVSRPPEMVVASAGRARLRCEEYMSGKFNLPDANTAAALFVEALLAHLAAEDAWLAKVEAHQQERMHTVA